MRDLKLKGSIDSKFKQLEVVVTRMARKQAGTKTFVANPVSMVGHYCAEQPEDGTLALLGMFKGRIVKVLFRHTGYSGKAVPEYKALIGNDKHQQQITISNRKANVVMPVDVQVADGDFIKLMQVNPEVILQNVVMSILIEFDKSLSTVESIDTDEIVALIESADEDI
jgi:hypothetical protein